MLWILKMLIETPKAIIQYRRDYYNHKKIRKQIKQFGIVAGFYLHDEIYGADIHEWMAVCEHLSDQGKDIPKGLIDMALEREWIALKVPEDVNDARDTENAWREWENA